MYEDDQEQRRRAGEYQVQSCSGSNHSSKEPRCFHHGRNQCPVQSLSTPCRFLHWGLPLTGFHLHGHQLPEFLLDPSPPHTQPGTLPSGQPQPLWLLKSRVPTCARPRSQPAPHYQPSQLRAHLARPAIKDVHADSQGPPEASGLSAFSPVSLLAWISTPARSSRCVPAHPQPGLHHKPLLYAHPCGETLHPWEWVGWCIQSAERKKKLPARRLYLPKLSIEIKGR